MTTFYQCGDANSAVFPESNHVAKERGRPVVVIDPEDREASDRLTEMFREFRYDYDIWEDRMQAVLREFANPKPPKPEEPTGLGAVVCDTAGLQWVLVFNRGGRHLWRASGPGGEATWGEIDAAKVLSPGVTE